jgi:hypothetical protein
MQLIIREEIGNSHGFERSAFLFSRANKAFEADKKPQENFVIAWREQDHTALEASATSMWRPRHAAVF